MRLKISKQADLLASLVFISTLVFLAFANLASAGTVERGQTTNLCKGEDRLMDFENGIDDQIIESTIPGLKFTTTGEVNWLVGDFRARSDDGYSPKYNGKYPLEGGFTSDGYNWAWLGPSVSSGRIDFTAGTASNFSLLTSTQGYGIALEAYDTNGNLLDRAPLTGLTRPNYNTGLMDRLTVNVGSPDMAYVMVQGTGNFFLVDDICTDAPLPSTGAPTITGYYPPSPVNDTAGATRAFNVTVNQTVTVTWYVNDSIVQSDDGVTDSLFNIGALQGYYNVTAVATNPNGTDTQTWDWLVTEPPTGPAIIDYSPASPVYDISGATRTFNVTVNQTVNIIWYLNGTQVLADDGVTDSAYTNNNATTGSWNVTAVATNVNGTAMQIWDWIVTEPPTGPAIIEYSPPSPVNDTAGVTRAFNITINQSVIVQWFINGTQVGYDENVTESQYVNMNAEPGSWNVTAVATNVNGTAMQAWDWIVTEPVYAPAITAYSPASPAYDISGIARTFNITVNQTVNVVWYLNDVQVYSQEAVTDSAYTNNNPAAGSWSVTAVATNINGTAIQVWDWIVTEPIYGPSITGYSPESPAYDISGSARTFSVTANQTVNIFWYLNGIQVYTDEGVTDSAYTNNSAATGSWNVTAVATNVNGTAMQVWDWIVTEPPTGPAIIYYSPPSPVNGTAGETRAFNITINQSVIVRWFINGTQVGYDENVTESQYVNTKAEPGSWNVTAVATNINGTAMQIWDWVVTEPVYAPAITAYSPASPAYDISGATRTFTVTINQSVTVRWFVNGTQVGYDEGVIESQYVNINAEPGSWNVTAVATNVNGTAMQVWDWIVTELVYGPSITGYSPVSPTYDISGATRTFNVTVNQTVNVVWYLNGTQVLADEGITESTYTNTNAAPGLWNVTAVATNVNGTAMQVWDWMVTEPVYGPSITAYSPASPVYDISGATRTFTVTVNQSVTVRWFVDGTQVGYDEDVTDSVYTNTNAATGSWNVTAVATNVNGTAMQVWNWIVTEPVYAPAITAYSPASPAYDISGIARTFNITVNQTVNVVWYLNDAQVYSQEAVTDSAYTNNNPAAGSWNVTAVATNANGTAMQVWDWVVTEPVYAPAITAYSPTSPVYDISGAARTFTVAINQSVTVRWFVNGTQVGYDEGVTDSAYTNTNAATGSWNVTAVATNANGTAMQVWDWIVTEPVYAPAITAYSPESPAYDISGAARTFTVTVNQTVNVSWYLNGDQVYADEGITESAYTNTNAVAGSWNVTAVAINANGTAMQVWDWVVTEPVYGPSITAYSPASPAYDISGSARTFNITINQTVNVIWYLNGTQVYTQEGVTESAYTNISAAKGIWVINAVATNVNGTVSNDWTWDVRTQSQQDKINATIVIKPECLNLGSKGKLTAFITLPQDYNVTNINLSTVVLEGAHAVKGIVSGRNGGTLIVKFNRQDLINVSTGNAVTLTVTGKVLYEGAWVDFEGSDTIRVMDHGKCNECASDEEQEHDECDEHDGCKEDDKCKDNDGCKEDDKCKDNDRCKEGDKCKENDGCKEQGHQEDDEDGKSKDHSENEHHPDKSLKDKKSKNNKNFDE